MTSEDLDDDVLLPRDDTCPWCDENVEYWYECYDGFDTRCRDCGRRIVAVAWHDGTMSWVRIEREPADPRTHRQRNRARWRRQGRR